MEEPAETEEAKAERVRVGAEELSFRGGENFGAETIESEEAEDIEAAKEAEEVEQAQEAEESQQFTQEAGAEVLSDAELRAEELWVEQLRMHHNFHDVQEAAGPAEAAAPDEGFMSFLEESRPSRGAEELKGLPLDSQEEYWHAQRSAGLSAGGVRSRGPDGVRSPMRASISNSAEDPSGPEDSCESREPSGDESQSSESNDPFAQISHLITTMEDHTKFRKYRSKRSRGDVPMLLVEPLRVQSRVEGWRVQKTQIDWHKSRRLGEGAVSLVYKASWRKIDVAVKMLREDFTDSDQNPQLAAQDMMQEVLVASRFNRHPNLVLFLGACLDQDQTFIVYEYFALGSMDQFYHRRAEDDNKRIWRPEPRLALQWCRHLAQGLAYLHDASPSLIHRDIKPGNLFISNDLQTLKIGDFGLTTFISEGGSDSRQMTGMTGSLRFMAPEVFLGESHYDRKIDIFSAAMVMYFIGSGRLPFQGNPVPNLLLARQMAEQGIRPSMHSVKGLESKEFQTLIRQAWHRDKSKRPEASDMARTLEVLLAAETSKPEGLAFKYMAKFRRFGQKASTYLRRPSM